MNVEGNTINYLSLMPYEKQIGNLLKAGKLEEAKAVFNAEVPKSDLDLQMVKEATGTYGLLEL